MIIISNKPDLVYHNGLILLIFAATILLPLTTKETLIICIISISTYISAVLQTDIDSVGIIYNNIFTLTLAATIGITATKLKSKLLFQHFLLNYKLNKQLIKITKTQEELIDKETSQAMTNLSSELIHEINNPLNFTITALNTLNTINQRNKNIELQEAYTDISTGISRIKNTINNLKNLSLIQKPIDKTNFNIFEAIETALKLQEEIIDNINVRILIDKNLTIHASKIHFIQIFINLIKNATQSIKSPEVKDPEITIVAQKEKDQITFSIADNGPVIKNFKTATINKLSIIQSKNNPGIDLNIAIKLIEQQNSKIKVESTKDHNRISFTI
ncbi:MAG: hypothetical protein ISQ34_04635 [Rickettsiales bacterium]|nr:hypothetical protein [Rickettsiales bacterium]